MKKLTAIFILCMLMLPSAYGITTTDQHGNEYVGSVKYFFFGPFHGQGTYTFGEGEFEGDEYVGEYKDDKFHGQGTYTYSSGNKYVGAYKDDKFHGQGTYTYSSGNKYVGEFKDGKRNGQGTYTWPDGRKYVGEFKDGKSDGQGTFTKADGAKYVGEWKGSDPWNGTEYDKDGSVTAIYSEGVRKNR